jgi:transcriptional regulator with XRE-family HTH domain
VESGSNTIGNNIARKLDDLGWTQLELANRTGLTTASISKIVAGRTQTRLANLQVIARALGCTVEELQGVKYSLFDAAEILSLFANKSPLMQKVLLAILHEDPKLVLDESPELSRAVQLLLKVKQ